MIININTTKQSVLTGAGAYAPIVVTSLGIRLPSLHSTIQARKALLAQVSSSLNELHLREDINSNRMTVRMILILNGTIVSLTAIVTFVVVFTINFSSK